MPQTLLSLALLFVSAQLFAAEAPGTRSVIESAIQGSIREPSEIARDSNRKPAQALDFVGLDSSMKVLVAVDKRDENALSQVGNDALYPPCESCHQAYQK